MWDVIGTGLIAGIIAALANILIAHSSNRTQRVITKMQNVEKLNEIELRWNGETRKLISEFVETCFKINQIYNEKNRLIKQYKDAINSKSSDAIFNSITEGSKAVIKNSNQIFSTLYRLQAQIKMHLYDEQEYLVNDINSQIKKIVVELESNETLPTEDIDELIALSRKYFSAKWKQLKNESAS